LITVSPKYQQPQPQLVYLKPSTATVTTNLQSSENHTKQAQIQPKMFGGHGTHGIDHVSAPDTKISSVATKNNLRA